MSDTPSASPAPTAAAPGPTQSLTLWFLLLFSGLVLLVLGIVFIVLLRKSIAMGTMRIVGWRLAMLAAASMGVLLLGGGQAALGGVQLFRRFRRDRPAASTP